MDKGYLNLTTLRSVCLSVADSFERISAAADRLAVSAEAASGDRSAREVAAGLGGACHGEGLYWRRLADAAQAADEEAATVNKDPMLDAVLDVGRKLLAHMEQVSRPYSAEEVSSIGRAMSEVGIAEMDSVKGRLVLLDRDAETRAAAASRAGTGSIIEMLLKMRGEEMRREKGEEGAESGAESGASVK